MSNADAQYLLAKSQSAPQWKTERLYIPSRDLKCWVPTDPLAQIQWTWDKNRNTNGHYVNVVKALKWWRRRHPDPEHPKGYPLEHLVGLWCPDRIGSVAEGVVLALEGIRDAYALDAFLRRVPCAPDHGVQEDNVLQRLTGEEFAGFHDLIRVAATIARDAYDATDKGVSVQRWQDLFGDEFPDAPDDDNGGRGPGGGFTPRGEQSLLKGGRFS